MFTTFTSIHSVLKHESIGSSPITPLYYYTFNTSEVSGTTVNTNSFSTNTQALTLSADGGVAVTSTDPKEGDQCFHSASGTYTAINTGTMSIVTDPNIGVTISFWAKFNTVPSTLKCMLSIGVGTASGSYRVNIYCDQNVLEWQTKVGAATLSSIIIFIPDTSIWYHIALTWIVSTLVVYLNGVARTFSTTTLPSTTWTSLSINKRVDGSFGNADCEIDCVRIYNQKLTAAQISAIYSAGN